MTTPEPRTFQARELNEALALVRREFGPEAIILETRRVPGRALGLLGGSFVQVTAQPPEFSAAPARKRSTSAVSKPSRRAVGETVEEGDRYEPLARAIRRRPAVAVPAQAPHRKAGLARFARMRRLLLANMVPREICEGWLSKLAHRRPGSTPAAQRTALAAIVAESLGEPVPLAWPGTRVAAFIGPSGVGKSTTIAKLATRAVLFEDRRVAIVTLDDERPGGTALVAAYARALDVPCVSVRGAGTLSRALRSVRDRDLVLLDTPGIRPRDEGAVVELSQVLTQAGEAITRHLCFAASTRQQELDRLLATCAALGPDAALVTKLDEAIAIGTLFAAPVEHDLALSFVTTGPEVPDDIAPANARDLANALIGETST
ncbi:MAG: hypothetical protein D6705_09690 [Deltaproteobacteria bacterium]|nr:MAG: hypothetical protein D6705_09690 [Deltaproteobacteria bacterium]